MAEKMPMGTATIRDMSVIITVLIREGSREAFSLVNFSSNREGRRLGTPITTMYATRNSRTATVMKAAMVTITRRNREKGDFLYCLPRWCA